MYSDVMQIYEEVQQQLNESLPGSMVSKVGFYVSIGAGREKEFYFNCVILTPKGEINISEISIYKTIMAAMKEISNIIHEQNNKTVPDNDKSQGQ